MAKKTINNQLYIIRGIPGSGKSTLAQDMKDKGLVEHVVEADQFMVDEQGNYKFEVDKIKRCHEECQSWVKYYLDEGYNVAVANTFTRVWEMTPYFKMGYPYTVITAKGEFQNIHNVPNKTVQQMKDRWEDYKDG